MPAAWSNTRQYLQGETVTYGGHTYEWGSADPSRGVAPPGGSWTQLDAPPVAGLTITRGLYDTGNDNNGYTAAVASPTPIPWFEVAGASTDHPLDLTDHAQPTVKESGVYSVTVSANPDSNVTNSLSYLSVTLNAGTPDQIQQYAQMVQGAVAVSVTGTYYMEAGSRIAAFVANREAADAVWYASMAVVRIG
jgi:hypothetical protein